jgi:hypothetical protein
MPQSSPPSQLGGSIGHVFSHAEFDNLTPTTKALSSRSQSGPSRVSFRFLTVFTVRRPPYALILAAHVRVAVVRQRSSLGPHSYDTCRSTDQLNGIVFHSSVVKGYHSVGNNNKDST